MFLIFVHKGKYSIEQIESNHEQGTLIKLVNIKNCVKKEELIMHRQAPEPVHYINDLNKLDPAPTPPLASYGFIAYQPSAPAEPNYNDDSPQTPVVSTPSQVTLVQETPVHKPGPAARRRCKVPKKLIMKILTNTILVILIFLAILFAFGWYNKYLVEKALCEKYEKSITSYFWVSEPCFFGTHVYNVILNLLF